MEIWQSFGVRRVGGVDFEGGFLPSSNAEGITNISVRGWVDGWSWRGGGWSELAGVVLILKGGQMPDGHNNWLLFTVS